MKHTGVVRQLDEMGRFVIPKELRETRYVDSGDSVEFLLDGDKIVIRAAGPRMGCTFCGAAEATTVGTLGKLVCNDCCRDAEEFLYNIS